MVLMIKGYVYEIMTDFFFQDRACDITFGHCSVKTEVMMIRRLSEDVQGRLRTGVALTSVAQCVEELVLNSVDAGATCVAVRVDLQSVTIQVIDNGAGITKEQLPHVGQRLAMLINCVCSGCQIKMMVTLHCR